MSTLQWGCITPDNKYNAIGNTVQKNSAKTEFMEFMNMSTAEKMRTLILKGMGMTEEQVKNLPPEERKKIEAEILERMKNKIEPNQY